MIGVWILAAFLAQASAGPSPGEAAARVELTRLELVWNEAHLHGDADVLDHLWASDLVVIVPRMPAFSKSDALGMARSGKMHFGQYETTDIQVRLHGDSAIVTGRLRRSRTMGEKTMQDDWQFTKAYVRSGNEWQVVAFHASEAPQ